MDKLWKNDQIVDIVCSVLWDNNSGNALDNHNCNSNHKIWEILGIQKIARFATKDCRYRFLKNTYILWDNINFATLDKVLLSLSLVLDLDLDPVWFRTLLLLPRLQSDSSWELTLQ
jgi:hypothetical protein